MSRVQLFVWVYFALACGNAGYTYYQLHSSGVYDRMQEKSKNFRIGSWIGLFGIHGLLWPLSLIGQLIVLSVPALRDPLFKLVRRELIDPDDRFTQPQMPELCGSLSPSGSGVDYCVKAKRHDGLHSNRSPLVPHGDDCPCVAREWTDGESVCSRVEIKICALHGNHEGRCKTSKGEEFDPTPTPLGPV